MWLDRCSRKIVSGDVRDPMPEDLVSEALRRALVVRRPPAGLVMHSDQGSQYTATRFKALVAKHGAQQSMSRRDNWYLMLRNAAGARLRRVPTGFEPLARACDEVVGVFTHPSQRLETNWHASETRASAWRCVTSAGTTTPYRVRPTPNRFGATSRLNCSTVGAFLA